MSATNSEAVDRCIAMTAEGRQCKNSAEPNSEYCWLNSHGPNSENSASRDSGEPDLPVNREVWEVMWPVIHRITGREALDDATIADSAAKAALREMGAGAAEYREIFGDCSHPDCSRGANGFDAEVCHTHQDSGSPDEDDDSGVSLSDLSDSEKEKLVAEVIDSL